MINIDDFSKVEMTVGKILAVEAVPESKKLLKLTVDFKEEKPRTVFSGIAQYHPDPQILVGTKCMFVTNLEPRMIMGAESQAMILALSTDDGKFSLLRPTEDIPEGTKAK